MIQRLCPWTASEVAKATGGELRGAGTIPLLGVSTDTRDPLGSQLFVALVGDRFDAHEFLDKAVEGGATGLLVSRDGLARAERRGFAPPPSVALILVDDTLRALGALGAFHRRKHAIPVLGLTGSNGKTTTKEMIAAILAESRAVLKTEGNLNNLVGVPMTLLGLTAQHQVAVIEMGMNTRGEIARYAEIAQPDLGLVTNVGPAHIGKLGSIEAIAEAKGELYQGLDRQKGIAVVNLDDARVRRVADQAGVARVRTFGRSEAADVRLCSTTPTEGAGPDGVVGQQIRLTVDGQALEFELPVPGEHNALNAAAAVAVATAPLGASFPAQLGEIARGLPKAARIAGRMIFEKIAGYLVVDDCYNANSASMIAAIETMAGRVRSRGGRLVAVLGEILEVGEHGAREHALVGRALAEQGAQVIAAFGPNAGPIVEAARAAAHGPVALRHEPDDIEALSAWVIGNLKKGDVILVKGSRGMKMERFIERLRGESS